VHVVHTAGGRAVERLPEEQQALGGAERLRTLARGGGKQANAPGRQGNDRPAERLAVLGEGVDVGGGGGRQHPAGDQPRPLGAGEGRRGVTAGVLLRRSPATRSEKRRGPNDSSRTMSRVQRSPTTSRAFARPQYCP